MPLAIGTEVRVDFDDGSVGVGTVEGVGPRGHKVRLVTDRVVWVAWWRLSRV